MSESNSYWDWGGRYVGSALGTICFLRKEHTSVILTKGTRCTVARASTWVRSAAMIV